MTASARRIQVHQPDRGPRVEQKLLHLLANVQADGSHPLAEVISATLPRLRRGMTMYIITGSTDRTWVHGLSALRRRGVAALVILLDRASYIEVDPDDQSRAELGGPARPGRIRHRAPAHPPGATTLPTRSAGGPRPCLAFASGSSAREPAG